METYPIEYLTGQDGWIREDGKVFGWLEPVKLSKGEYYALCIVYGIEIDGLLSEE